MFPVSLYGILVIYYWWYITNNKKKEQNTVNYTAIHISKTHKVYSILQ